MQEIDRLALGAYIQSLNDDIIECYETKDYAILDLECGMMARMIEHCETIYVISQLRTLAAYRIFIPAWERLAQAAKVEFKRRELPDKLLAGLVTYD